ncbi:peptidase M16 [Gemmatimonadetes bacterium T265]|nr:peptidase M16 [Gemmatimonadetes bacterium T265]
MTAVGTVAPEAPPRPGAGAPRPYHFPHFERRALPNGLRLVVAPVHRLPLVSVVVVVDAGAASDPAGQEGLAVLTARALVEGTATMDAVALVERVERLGSALDSGADWDAAVVSLTALAPKLAEAFEVLADVLVRPAFPVREVDRLKGERLAELLHLRSEPRGLAEEAFARAVYAGGSRYARAEAGGEASVAALTEADVRAFHAARYHPAAATVVVAGDVTADEAEALVARTLGTWGGPAAPAPAPVDAPGSATRRVHLVPKADAAQSEVRLGHVGVPRDTPDYFPLLVMNSILGGLFNSRVNMNLRERHGYTYGARSGFDWRRAAGPFSVESAVASDVTVAAAKEMLIEIDRVREESVGDDELSLATSYLDGVFPIRYETTAAIASALASAVVYGLPDDYFDAYRERVRGVTAEDVRRVAREHLRPEALQLLVVGDPAAVQGPLEALGFGPLVVHDVDAVVR